MATNKTLLITRPNHDPTVNYLYFFASLVIDEAKRKGLKILDLKSEKANRKNVESYIKSRSPDLIYLNGHGSAEILAGWNNEPIFIFGENESLVHDTIVYSLSCRTGAKLGKSFVGKGKAKAFIGYERDFVFMKNHAFETKPLQDKIAGMFLLPSNLVVTTLIKNHSVKEAFDRSQKEMRKNLNYLLSSSSSFEEKQSAPFLYSNMRYQVLEGNEEARI
jgi:hypothetical protein